MSTPDTIVGASLPVATGYATADLLSGAIPLTVVTEPNDTIINTPDGFSAAICVHPPELARLFAMSPHLLSVARMAKALCAAIPASCPTLTEKQSEARDMLSVSLYIVRELLSDEQQTPTGDQS